MSAKSIEISNENQVFYYLKGLLLSVITSLALVVVFALILKWFELSDGLIVPVTFAIKYLSVFLGSLVAVRGNSKGLLKGAFFGLLYISSSFLIFSFLSKSFAFDVTTILDFASSIIIGGIVGVVKVNKN